MLSKSSRSMLQTALTLLEQAEQIAKEWAG
jgi:hypothetical protein